MIIMTLLLLFFFGTYIGRKYRNTTNVTFSIAVSLLKEFFPMGMSLFVTKFLLMFFSTCWTCGWFCIVTKMYCRARRCDLWGRQCD